MRGLVKGTELKPEEVLWRPPGKSALFLIKGYSFICHYTQMEGLDLLQLCCHQPETKADTRRRVEGGAEKKGKREWDSESADLATGPCDFSHFCFIFKERACNVSTWMIHVNNSAKLNLYCT